MTNLIKCLDPMELSTNERVNMEGHVSTVQWYSLFLRNMDCAHPE